MASVNLKTAGGGESGKVELDESIFGIEPNVAVMHQVVTAQLAARRSGSHNTKTRAERRGGGAKPWKQKGTGRARQGSIRSPQWKGGGVVHGPKPRSYAQRTPKKMVRLALRSALSDRAGDGKIVVVDSWGFGDLPKTKDAASTLSALGVEGRALVVLGPDDIVAWKSFRNLPQVHPIEPGELNAYDVLVSDWVVFTTDTLPSGRDHETAAPARKPRADLAQRKTAADAKAETATSKPAPAPKAPAVDPTMPEATDDLQPDPNAPGAHAVAEAPTSEAPATDAPAKKKVVKKKVVKKIIKKKAIKKKVAKQSADGSLFAQPGSEGGAPAPTDEARKRARDLGKDS
jgi:large subunit ribosomal protein L4